jgi:pyrroline-5-carboxylate reductase
MQDKKICFIGAGNMAEAIIKGILDREIIDSENILCVDINNDRLEYLQKKYAVNIEKEDAKYADVFILAVKPNNVEEVIEFLKPFLTPSKLIISIMAGIKITKIEKLINLSKAMQVVRVMPNTPALVAKGAIGYSFNDTVSMTNRDFTSVILSAVGVALKLPESDLDAVTALSGSGPAYVFYLAEAMIEAGIELGLSDEVSKILAVQTIYGAGEMLHSSKEMPRSLRKKVTSKGGTTEAATKYFDKNGFKDIVKGALTKAKNKSIALSKA